MDDNVSDLQIKVGQILEDADIPTDTVDQIMKLIETAEYKMAIGDDGPFTSSEVEK